MKACSILGLGGKRKVTEALCVPRAEQKLTTMIENLIYLHQCFIFEVGLSNNFEIMAAEMLLEYKMKYPFLKLYCVIPYRGHEKLWPLSYQEKYHDILSKADKIEVLYENCCRECILNRNKYMVSNSTNLIALYGGRGGGTKVTIDYAHEQGLDIDII